MSSHPVSVLDSALGTGQQPGDPRNETSLESALRHHPHTRYFRKHVPSGTIEALVLTPATVRAQIGPFDEESLQTRWQRTSLLEFISDMNRLGRGIWMYWPAG